jgi:aarF domain-containing kinase
MKKLIQVFSVLSGKGSVDTSGIVQEISSVFNQETDYLAELGFLKEYGEKSASIEGLWVPRGFEEFSTRRVLTMEFGSGVSLSEAVRSHRLKDDEREYYADLFMNLYSQEFCVWGLVQTDPNLGNFLLDLPKSKLIPLDFGACKRYSPEFRKQYCQLVMAAYAKDREALSRLVEGLGFLSPKEGQPARDALNDLVIESMSPFRATVHDFQDETYPSQMRELTRKLIRSLEHSPPPRDIIFLHRKLGGIFQILRRLESKRSLKPYLTFFERTASGS